MSRKFNDIKIGDIVICCDQFAHDYVDYELRIVSVETETEEGETYIVAYGEGVTEEDDEYIEDMGYSFRVDIGNFVRYSNEYI